MKIGEMKKKNMMRKKKMKMKMEARDVTKRNKTMVKMLWPNLWM